MPLPVPLEGGWGARYQYILFTIVFQACIRHLRHGELFAVFLFHTDIRENLKYRCLKPNFIECFLPLPWHHYWNPCGNCYLALIHTSFTALVMAITNINTHRRVKPTALLQVVFVVLNSRMVWIFKGIIALFENVQGSQHSTYASNLFALC